MAWGLCGGACGIVGFTDSSIPIEQVGRSCGHTDDTIHRRGAAHQPHRRRSGAARQRRDGSNHEQAYHFSNRALLDILGELGRQASWRRVRVPRAGPSCSGRGLRLRQRGHQGHALCVREPSPVSNFPWDVGLYLAGGVVPQEAGAISQNE